LLLNEAFNLIDGTLVILNPLSAANSVYRMGRHYGICYLCL